MAAGDLERDTALGRRYLQRTLRSGFAVTGLIVAMLLAYRQIWAIGPLAAGMALGAVLLIAWDVFVRRVFHPSAALRANRGGSGAMLLLAFVKYPLVALLIWTITHFWNLKQVMVFTGGFILLQIIIGLRALGQAVTGQTDNAPV